MFSCSWVFNRFGQLERKDRQTSTTELDIGPVLGLFHALPESHKNWDQRRFGTKLVISVEISGFSGIRSLVGRFRLKMPTPKIPCNSKSVRKRLKNRPELWWVQIQNSSLACVHFFGEIMTGGDMSCSKQYYFEWLKVKKISFSITQLF